MQKRSTYYWLVYEDNGGNEFGISSIKFRTINKLKTWCKSHILLLEHFRTIDYITELTTGKHSGKLYMHQYCDFYNDLDNDEPEEYMHNRQFFEKIGLKLKGFNY